MILYHGSNQLITKIDLSKSKDFKDFGRGFYLTKDYTRAVAMAQRTTAIIGEGVKLGKDVEIGAYCIVEGNVPVVRTSTTRLSYHVN